MVVTRSSTIDGSDDDDDDNKGEKRMKNTGENDSLKNDDENTMRSPSKAAAEEVVEVLGPPKTIEEWVQRCERFLSDVKAPWKQRSACLKMLQTICDDDRTRDQWSEMAKTNASVAQEEGDPDGENDDDETPKSLNERVGYMLKIQLADLRSAVVREACKAVIGAAKSAGKAFSPCLLLVLPTLVEQSGNGNKVISRYAQQATIASVTFAQPSDIASTCLEHLTSSKNKKIRCVAVGIMSRAVRDYVDEDEMRDSMDTIEKVLMIGQADAAPDVRSETRECFLRYKARYPDRASSFVDGKDRRVKRRFGVPVPR